MISERFHAELATTDLDHDMLIPFVDIDRLVFTGDLVHIRHTCFVRGRTVSISVQEADSWSLPISQYAVFHYQPVSNHSRVFVYAALSTVSVNACKKAIPVAIRSLPV